MTLIRQRSTCLVGIILAASLWACGGGDLTLPGDAQPSHIDIVTGNAQAGIVGTALPLPLVVKVTDDLGRPVSSQTVEFTVQAGDGQVAPGSVLTDAAGRASTTWTVGPAAGAQEVEARAVGRGAPDNLTVTFTATAVAGSGSLLAAVSGDDQSASVNSVLPESLVVHASDAAGNPVSGIAVEWTVQGGGSISPETVVTGDDGRAAALRVLGPAAGQQTAQASADGLAGSPVTFVHTALASSPSALVQVSGDNQAAPAGFEVAEDLVVQLTDANGNGVGGRPVTWVVATGGGTVNPVNSATDPNGFARTRWTLGTSAGGNSLNAVFSGLPPVHFAATASADVPSKLALVSGDNQSGVVGQPLVNPLAVKVTDANDNPVENVSVAWTADGGGSVSSATSATDADGVAAITRTLGATPGTYTTLAAVVGLAVPPLTFTSTAAAGPAAKIVITTQPGAATQNGAQLSPQPAVQVQDAVGNNVGSAGLVITAELVTPPAGASLGGDPTKETDATGVAAFTDLRITGPAGVYKLQFTSSGLSVATSSDVALTAGPVSASQSTIVANPASVPAGTASTITVTARDVSGNPIQGASVVLAATGAGNTIAQPSGTTDASGQVSGTFGSSAAGAHTVSATINGTAISTTATVTVTAGAVSASQSTVSASPATVGAGAQSTITVTARDAGGNPIPGATVLLAATGSGNTLGQPSGTTNSSGVATGTFASTSLGGHTISATINGTAITAAAAVTVTPGSVSASQSTVTAAPNPIQVGAAPSVVTVTAKDGLGNPIPGASVSLSVTGTGNTVSAPSATNASGVSTATFTSTKAGAHVIMATINGVAITDNATVNVTPGAVSASQSTVNADPNTIIAGSGSATVTVTARDAGGNLIQGASVVLAASGTGNAIGQPGATNSSGVATGTFGSTSVGSHTITVKINSVDISDNSVIAVTAGPVSASQSSVNAAPDQITAGGAPSTVTITARDAGGNPVPGAFVLLSVTGSGNTVQAPSPTNGSGVTTASFTSTEAGPHQISATINGVAIADNATVTVEAGPAAILTFTQQPTTTQAGQTFTPAVVVAVADQFGNPTSGTVEMSLNVPPLASGSLSGTLSVAAVGGSATFSDLSVDSPAFLAYSLTATVGGISATSAGFFVTP